MASKPRKYIQLPLPWPFWLQGVLSILVAISWWLATYSWQGWRQFDRISPAIKVSLVRQKPPKLAEQAKETPDKQVVEVVLEETLPAPQPDYLGRVDHQTAHPTKVANPRQNASDASRIPGKMTAASQGQDLKSAKAQLTLKEPEQGATRRVSSKLLAEFLPQAADVMAGSSSSGGGDGGFQDYLKDDLENGEVIDVNTTSFRWLGYFTNVRKNVMQAYYSPYGKFGRSQEIQDRLDRYGSAQLQGKAKAQLTITRSGLLVASELVASSGDALVDDYWLQVLNLAAPYPPLPKDYPKETLQFTYTLEYEFIYRRQSSIGTFEPQGGRPF